MDQLTPRERDCLGLVARGRSSKEIALELGLSPYTVDEYVRSAIAKLGVSNRREAARLVTAEASVGPPEKLGDGSGGVADAEPSAATIAPVRTGESPRRQLPFLRQGRQINDLTAFQRLFWILVIAVAIIVLFSQLSQGMAVIQAMFQGR